MRLILEDKTERLMKHSHSYTIYCTIKAIKKKYYSSRLGMPLTNLPAKQDQGLVR